MRIQLRAYLLEHSVCLRAIVIVNGEGFHFLIEIPHLRPVLVHPRLQKFDLVVYFRVYVAQHKIKLVVTYKQIVHYLRILSGLRNEFHVVHQAMSDYLEQCHRIVTVLFL